MPEADSPRGLILWIIGVVVVTGLALWALFLARQTLLIIYVSTLLAVGFSPIVRLVERQTLLPIGRLPRWLAILLLYLAILGAIAALVWAIFPPLITQARAFASNLPGMISGLQQSLVRRGILPEHMTVGEIVQQAPGADVVGGLLLGFWSVVGGLLGLFTILVLTFYLLVDSESIFETLLRFVPRRRRDRVRRMSRVITQKVSAWLTGQLILGGIIGTSAAIGLGLLGVPYFYVLALIAAIGELIPYIGPILAAIPAVAVALTISWKLALAVAIFYLVQQQVEGSLIVPKVMERQVGLSPVVILIAVLLGGSLLGVPGAILAVPTAAIAQVIFQELTTEDRPKTDRTAA
jgi:predicted PurR-regulated permease PerM